MDSIENRPAPCVDALSRLEEGATPETDPIVAEHLKTCPECRAEYRIRTLCASLNEEPPTDLPASIMHLIRTERTRELTRRTWIRRLGGLAAAFVLIPMAAVFVPLLLRGGLSLSDAAYDTAAPSTYGVKTESAVTTTAIKTETFTETAAPDILHSVLTTTTGTAVSETTAVPDPAPDHLKKQDVTISAPTVSVMGESESLPDRLRQVLTSMLGEVDGEPSTLIRKHGITRDALKAAAEKANVKLTDAELNSIFGDA